MYASLVKAHGLSSWGVWACPQACGILILQPGVKPTSPAFCRDHTCELCGYAEFQGKPLRVSSELEWNGLEML